MSFFTIAPTNDHLRANDVSRKGSVTFSVQNKTGHAREIRAIIVTSAPEEAAWYTVREPVVTVRVDETVQFIVDVEVPAAIEPGSYEFQLKVLAEDDPDDTFNESQRLPVEVPAAEPRPAPPWWIWVIIAAVVAVGVGVVLFFVLREGGDDPEETPTPTPSSTVEPSPTGTGGFEIPRLNFSTPSLGGANARVFDPLMLADGAVTFTSASGSGVVGIVLNDSTSACIDGSPDDPKLATGTQAGGDSSVGRAAFAIRATFESVAPPPISVTADIQTLAGQTVRIRLFDETDTQVGLGTAAAQPPAGQCGLPGGPRAVVQVTATSTQPVAYAVIEVASGGVVFVVDNFTVTSE